MENYKISIEVGNEPAQILLKHTPDEFRELNTTDEDAFNLIFNELILQKCMFKIEVLVYDNIMRLSATKITPLNVEKIQEFIS